MAPNASSKAAMASRSKAAPAVKEDADFDPSGEFPKMLFGPKGEQKIVKNADAQKALGPKWKETPGADRVASGMSAD